MLCKSPQVKESNISLDDIPKEKWENETRIESKEDLKNKPDNIKILLKEELKKH